jgi:hypothetical protein
LAYGGRAEGGLGAAFAASFRGSLGAEGDPAPETSPCSACGALPTEEAVAPGLNRASRTEASASEPSVGSG